MKEYLTAVWTAAFSQGLNMGRGVQLKGYGTFHSHN